MTRGEAGSLAGQRMGAFRSKVLEHRARLGRLVWLRFFDIATFTTALVSSRRAAGVRLDPEPNLRKLELLLSVALVSGCAFCQSDEHADAGQCATAAQRLHASSLQEKAWGAHLIASCHANNRATEIAGELGRMHPDMSGMMYVDVSGLRHLDYAWWTTKALLDALIQLRQPLEVSELSSIFGRFPTEGTILMLQDAPRSAVLLAKAREARVPTSLWVAASNALTRLRSPGFAVALLKELRLTNSVWVSDTGKRVPPGSPGHGFLSNSNMQVPPGYPPIGLYWLTAERVGSEELVSEGPAPFYSIYQRRIRLEPGVNRRVMFPSDGYCVECEEGCPSCQTARVDYLAELGHITSRDVAIAVNPLTEVAWSNPAQISAAVAQALVGQETAMRRLTKQLVSAGAMDVSDLDITLHIEARVEDFRSDRSIPLPQVQSIPFHPR